MVNVKCIKYLFLLLALFCGACNSINKIETNDPYKSDPAERVLAYQKKLLESDFVGANRYYSKRVLSLKLDKRKSKDCKKPEDCLTSADLIGGFEVSLAGGETKILKEIRNSDANRTNLVLAPPFPLSGSIRFELVREDNDWYIDRAFWENGEAVEGFEKTLPESKIVASEVISK